MTTNRSVERTWRAILQKTMDSLKEMLHPPTKVFDPTVVDASPVQPPKAGEPTEANGSRKTDSATVESPKSDSQIGAARSLVLGSPTDTLTADSLAPSSAKWTESNTTAVESLVKAVYARAKVSENEPQKHNALDKPKTGKDFKVDENVVAALPIPGTKIESAKEYGDSIWRLTAKINCRTPDGKAITYFHKAIEHEMSAHMIESDFESLKALNKVSNILAPSPYAWGSFKENPACHFMLTEFREVEKQPPEPLLFTKRIAELHQNSVSPTGKFGFHMKTTAGPIALHDDGWSDCWEEVFSNFLGHLLDLDGERNPPWPELEHIKHLIKARVIPRLLRPLQSNGRSIKPCLIHGDLWDGNAATDPETGEPFIFDPISFYAHNEYEIGDWRPPRHRLSRPEYVLEYLNNFPPSEPAEDWDSRNLLYSLTHNTGAAILYPKMSQRVAIHKDMKDLCMNFCYEELMTRLGGDAIPKQIDSPVDSEEKASSEPDTGKPGVEG